MTNYNEILLFKIVNFLYKMNILGIETSCDETAMAIINERRDILSHIVVSQIDIHEEFGGVVPEVAARNHLDVIDLVFRKLLEEAHLKAESLDIISATTGPGLIGGVIVGTVFAKTLSSVLKKPFIAVNHLEGHALTCRFTDNLEFPYILFLLSGGHCQILKVNNVGNYDKIGETIDDSLGETFDKVAQMIGLSYPGGPKIEQLAKNGNKNRFKFTKPLIDHHKGDNLYNFSFSGLKTAIKREIDNFGILTEQDKYDIAASFQLTVVDILNNRLENVIKNNRDIKNFVISGGVSANQFIKEELSITCQKYNCNLFTPPIKLCTDNGIMIANAALERYNCGFVNDLLVEPKAKWELEELKNA